MTTHVKLQDAELLLIDEVLEDTSQVLLDDKCQQIHQLLNSAFANKVQAVRELEAIRWTGEWTYDKHWNDLMQGRADSELGKLKDRLSYNWNTYVNVVRRFKLEGEFIPEATYNELKVAGVLIDAINLFNAVAPESEQLPLPRNGGQCKPYMGLLKRESATAVPSRNLEGFAAAFRQRLEAGNDSAPYLPANEQHEAVQVWRDTWRTLPLNEQFDKEGIPKPPIRRRSEELIQSMKDAGVSVTQQVAKSQYYDLSDEEREELKRERQEQARKVDAETREAYQKASEWVQSRKDEQERVKRELRMRDAQELEEVKSYVTEYHRALTDASIHVEKLRVFLRKVSQVKGTVYLTEMRAADFGLRSVHDDTLIISRIGKMLHEVCTMAGSSNPPQGVDPETINAEFEEMFS